MKGEILKYHCFDSHKYRYIIDLKTMSIIKKFNQFVNEGFGGDIASLKQRVYDDIRAFAEKYENQKELYDEAVHMGISEDEKLPFMNISFNGMYSVNLVEHDDDELYNYVNEIPLRAKDGEEFYPIGPSVIFGVNGIDVYFDGFLTDEFDENRDKDIKYVNLEDIENLDAVEEILDLLEKEWL